MTKEKILTDLKEYMPRNTAEDIIYDIDELYQEALTQKLSQLNEIVDNFIDAAHDTYMQCENETEKIRLDGQIKAYWEMKNHIEEALEIKGKK